MARDVRRSIGRRGGPPLGALAAVGLAAVALATTALAGCASADGTPASSGDSAPAATPAATGHAAAATPAATPTAPAAALGVDPTLIAVLPPDVGGVPIVELPDAEAEVRADPGVAALAERVAVGYAAAADRTDWAIASVVALRPGVFSDAMFRSWRDTYDAGACASAGGAAGHAEAAIGGRAAFITTCGTVVVHHVHLEAPDRLVAVTSSGAGRFGERIVGALRP